jgi:hypothetical protein
MPVATRDIHGVPTGDVVVSVKLTQAHRPGILGISRGAKLLQGVLALGISRYHPNPKAVIASRVRTDAATSVAYPQRDGANRIRTAEKRPCR